VGEGTLTIRIPTSSLDAPYVNVTFGGFTLATLPEPWPAMLSAAKAAGFPPVVVETESRQVKW
jgi:hypothetical protein